MFLVSPESFMQQFSNIKDIYSTTRIVRYLNENSQIVIRKTIPLEANSNIDSSMEVGLIIYRTSISRDEFIKTGSVIVFDDDSFLSFKDQAHFNYDELQLLQIRK